MILLACRIPFPLRKVSRSIFPSSGASRGRSQHFAIPAVLRASARPCDVGGCVFPGVRVLSDNICSVIRSPHITLKVSQRTISALRPWLSIWVWTSRT